MSGSQSVVVKSAGLHTFNNYYGSIPSGALLEALNVVIDRGDIVEPRRGFHQYGTTFLTSLDRSKQLISYKNRMLRHIGSQIEYDSDGLGTFSPFSGVLSEVESGLRIKSIEANGNLYITSDEGIKKISALSSNDFNSVSIEMAGGVKALELDASVDYSTEGFLTKNSSCAYKLVWGKKDLNENLLLGSPSPRVVVENVSPNSSAITKLNFPVPTDALDGEHFYQVYRTAVFDQTTPTDPGNECYLVIEDFPKIGNIINYTATNPSVITSNGHNLSNGAQIFLKNMGGLNGYCVVSNVTLNTFEIANPGLLSGTSGNWVQSFINTQDITPEDIRTTGTLLYTNPTSGEGISQSNEKPPFAKDITLYKGYTFLSNTKTVQRLNLNFLSVQNLVSGTSKITITNGITTNDYTFRGDFETYTVTFDPVALGASYLAGTGNPGYYFTINSANDSRGYYCWYASAISGAEIDPLVSGKIGIQVIISPSDTPNQIVTQTSQTIFNMTNDFNPDLPIANVLTIENADNGKVDSSPTESIPIIGFSITKDGNGIGEDTSNNFVLLPKVPIGTQNGPTVSQQLEEIARSLIRVINIQDPLVYSYYLSGPDTIPGQFLLENREVSGSAFYVYASSSSVGAEFNPTLPYSGGPIAINNVISSDEVRPNRVYYSKYQQPDSFPLANYIDIGPKDKEIKRILALRESLFIIKEDGIYRLSGTSAPFQVSPFDSSVQILAPDSAVVLNNQVYAFSTQGVVTITDTGVQVISRPIENLLLNIIRPGFNYKSATFGVSYESDRSYLLFTVSTELDSVATQCFRFNTFTNTWTRWEMSRTCGIVNFFDDKLYLGAGDKNFIEVERKSLTRTDYADRDYTLSLLADGVTENLLKVGNIGLAEVGDIVIQTQYLTINQFNRILIMLDSDNFIKQLTPSPTYLSLLQAAGGDNLRTKIVSLAQKLDLDPSVQTTTYFSDIDNYVQTITSTTHTSSQVKINFAINNILNTRYINISGSDTIPSIDGIHEIVAADATSVTINKVITSDGTVGTIQTDYSNPKDIQSCFNIIVRKLNLDTGIFFTNYPLSSDSINQEAIITSVDKINNKITTNYSTIFVFGEFTLYKAISSTIIWAPQFFGDPSIVKQVREGTVIFGNSNYSNSIISYSTEISPSFVDVPFTGRGNGDFGQFNWGGQNWGGLGAPIPLRTLIPREKQRCKFIQPKFVHATAFEKFSLYGISLTYRMISSRGYR